MLIQLQSLRLLGLFNLMPRYGDGKYFPGSLNVLLLFASNLFLSFSCFFSLLPPFLTVSPPPSATLSAPSPTDASAGVRALSAPVHLRVPTSAREHLHLSATEHCTVNLRRTSQKKLNSTCYALEPLSSSLSQGTYTEILESYHAPAIVLRLYIISLFNNH